MNEVKKTSDEKRIWMQLRLPESMHTWLAHQSRENGRSMVAEALYILKREQKRTHPPAIYNGIEPF